MNSSFDVPVPESDLTVVLPMLIIAVTGILALIVEMWRRKKNNAAVVATTIIGLLAAIVVLFFEFGAPQKETLAGMVRRDQFSVSMQLVIAVAALFVVIFSEGYLKQKRIAFGEFYPLLLWSTFGGMVMSASTNMLVLFLGLEVLSISLYVLAGFSRKEDNSEESALKYFLLGAFASGFMLYGMAMIYGATGSLDLGSIGLAWSGGDNIHKTLLLFGLALTIIGVGFKTSLVPFHQWTPDVYQGAPTNVSAFMATASKVAAFAFMARLLIAAEPLSEIWVPALGVIVALTILFGNAMALVQTDLKRMLGYSSISHAGYITLAIMAGAVNGANSNAATVPYYLLAYSIATVGTFAVISLAAQSNGEFTTINCLKGLWKRSPLAGGALILFLASLLGIPPLPGGIGKILIVSEAFAANMIPLAVILAIGSVISAGYYIRLFIVIISDEEKETSPLAPLNTGVALTSAIGMAAIVALVIGSGLLISTLKPATVKSELENVVSFQK